MKITYVTAFCPTYRQLLAGLLMVDCYMSWDQTVTLEMARRLAPYQLYWLEDILTPDDLAGQAALRGQVGDLLIAGGEHEFTYQGFRDILSAGALDLCNLLLLGVVD